MTTTQLIANEFSRILRSWLTPEEMQKINAANAIEPYCSTHEYCDPNEAMDEAFINILGVSIDVSSPEHVDLYNEAWGLARINQFNQTQ